MLCSNHGKSLFWENEILMGSNVRDCSSQGVVPYGVVLVSELFAAVCHRIHTELEMGVYKPLEQLDRVILPLLNLL